MTGQKPDTKIKPKLPSFSHTYSITVFNTPLGAGASYYSVLKLFTGLRKAAFIVCILSVINASNNINTPAKTNTHQLIVVLGLEVSPGKFTVLNFRQIGQEGIPQHIRLVREVFNVFMHLNGPTTACGHLVAF